MACVMTTQRCMFCVLTHMRLPCVSACEPCRENNHIYHHATHDVGASISSRHPPAVDATTPPPLLMPTDFQIAQHMGMIIAGGLTVCIECSPTTAMSPIILTVALMRTGTTIGRPCVCSPSLLLVMLPWPYTSRLQSATLIRRHASVYRPSTPHIG